MNLDQIFQQRQSVRKYSEQAVSRETIEQLLESARLAPSAVNFQPWKFIVCLSDEAKAVVRRSYPREWFNTAPLYLVACADHNASWKRPADGKDHADIDIAIAVQHIVLKATDLGLGTCWVCNFDPQVLKNGFRLTENIEPVVILPIGYPQADETELRNKKRKPLDEIAEWL